MVSRRSELLAKNGMDKMRKLWLFMKSLACRFKGHDWEFAGYVSQLHGFVKHECSRCESVSVWDLGYCKRYRHNSLFAVAEAFEKMRLELNDHIGNHDIH